MTNVPHFFIASLSASGGCLVAMQTREAVAAAAAAAAATTTAAAAATTPVWLCPYLPGNLLSIELTYFLALKLKQDKMVKPYKLVQPQGHV